jgi:hypothetical protein
MGGHLLSPEQNFLTLVLVGFTPFGSSLGACSARQRAARTTLPGRVAWA